MDLKGIDRELCALTGLDAAPAPQRRLSGGGGGSAECYAWRCGGGLAFVKVAARAAQALLGAEADGLLALGRAQALRVPRVLGSGVTGSAAFLALEWIEAAAPDERCEARLGTGLAALHAQHGPRCGFDHDNFIGRTPQQNAWTSDWAEFFGERRLRPQLELAAGRGRAALLREPGARLLGAVPALLAGHDPAPSLLHGDLWGGNWLATAQGEPVLIDPAVYYGDREADLAMSALFGGFGAAFYRAYEAALPRPPGWPARAELYNLYHLLNHANLFGGGYVEAARALMERLLARAQA